jgi:hypothetical protein
VLCKSRTEKNLSPSRREGDGLSIGVLAKRMAFADHLSGAALSWLSDNSILYAESNQRLVVAAGHLMLDSDRRSGGLGQAI